MALFLKRIQSRRLRDARTRRIKELSVLLVTLFVSIVILFSQVSRIPQFLIVDTQIHGDEALSDGVITEIITRHLSGTYFFVAPKNNRWLFPEQAISEEIRETFRRVKSVSFDVTDEQILRVSIIEREPVGVWCTDDTATCYFLDDGGLLFSLAPQFKGDLFYVYTGGIIEDEKIGNVFTGGS